MSCDKNCGFEDMTEEQINELWEDACYGQILMKYLDALEDAAYEDLEDVVNSLLAEVAEMIEETEETVH